MRALAAAILPMLAVTVFICSWTLLHWPAGQLWDGATSLGRNIPEPGPFRPLYQLNPYIVNPLLYPWLPSIQVHALLPAVGIVMLVQLVFCLLAVKRGEPQNGWLWMVAGAQVILLVVSLTAHDAAHLLFGLLVALGRSRDAILSPW